VSAVLEASGGPGFVGPVLLLAGAVGALAVAIAGRRRDRTSGSRLPLGAALLCSVAGFLVLTLTPGNGPNEHQLVPVVHIATGHPREYEVDVFLNVVANVLVFLPLGAALCLLGTRLRATALAALALSTLVEIAQLFVPGRTTSTDDVLLNTAGALLGYTIVRFWRRQSSVPIGTTTVPYDVRPT
jgi:VanZ family protein